RLAPLWHVAQHPHLSRRRVQQARQHLERGRLAGAVWAEEANQFTGPDVERDVVYRAHLLVVAVDERQQRPSQPRLARVDTVVHAQPAHRDGSGGIRLGRQREHIHSRRRGADVWPLHASRDHVRRHSTRQRPAAPANCRIMAGARHQGWQGVCSRLRPHSRVSATRHVDAPRIGAPDRRGVKRMPGTPRAIHLSAPLVALTLLLSACAGGGTTGPAAAPTTAAGAAATTGAAVGGAPTRAPAAATSAPAAGGATPSAARTPAATTGAAAGATPAATSAAAAPAAPSAPLEKIGGTVT